MNDSEDRIQQFLDQYRAAVLAKNVDGFMTMYLDEVRVFDAWGVWSYEGASWRQAVQQWFTSLGDETAQVGFDDIRMDVGADLAVVSAIATFAGISAAGQPLRSMQNRFTWALKQQDGVWKIAHEHSSAPIGFADMKAILQRKTAH